ncbi:MAG: chemotaxis protein CheR [Rhodospirillales bacterium]|nr:chemotaxis protein CheR [Rhodospirillales bacterium]
MPEDSSAFDVTPPGSFPIVGVGASAGGIEALEGFFRGMPDLPGLAVVVVTHLNPTRESVLPEILRRFTSMPVIRAEEGLEVRRDHVYVNVPNMILGIKERRLCVGPEAEARNHKPIDVFLSALALNLGELSAGVILSGGDGDGTLGIKAIKERGGLTMAQIADGYGPQHPSMPDSAIGTGLVDFAITAEEMGQKLAEFAADTVSIEASVARTANSPSDVPVEHSMPAIYAILRDQIGHDFSGYKTKTFVRRVRRRMDVAGLSSIEAYIERLEQQPVEVAALFRDLLINVTSFFRDAEAFRSLAELVIPKLFENRGADDSVRIWVPGCATGEEVFSIGILLREHMDTLSVVPRVQIFATDIDEKSLTIARAARYPVALLDGVTQERLDRFFVPDGGSFVIAKEVREMCIFSPHNIISDPPFSRIDLISCRNLLIYFGPQVQNQVIPTFHYALHPGGRLFLGSAENVSQYDDLFIAIDSRHRIFRRRSDRTATVRMPMTLAPMRHGVLADTGTRRPLAAKLALREAVDEQLLERFMPPHVVANREGDVLFFSGHTGKYLEAPPGVPTRHLFTMARKTLRLDLRSIFTEAVESGRSVMRDGIAVESEDGQVQIVSVTVEPLNQTRMPSENAEPLYLVLFHDRGRPLSQEEAQSRASAAHDGTAVHFERELRETRDRLQSLIEEYETALEELKSANEELVSVNEEMQSSNEELEASQEELQSVNEELHTVNAELHDKVDALDRANADLTNLFDITDVATVFLDRNLAIRSFTPAVGKVFNILPTDRGRPITDLAINLNLANLTADIEQVFAGRGATEIRADQEDKKLCFLVRISPYYDHDREIEGVVITFIDITTLTRAEARQKLLIAELQHRTRNLLAIVQSIARQTLGKGGLLVDFSARLEALGRVQNLMGGEAQSQIGMRKVIHMALHAVAPGHEGKTMISGPQVSLPFQQMQTFALVLHELATNAVKHGALRPGPGRLAISWVVRDEHAARSVTFHWRETDIVGLQPPTHRGFGMELVERASSFTLDTQAKLEFGASSIDCTIEIKLPNEQEDTVMADAAVPA